jgi:hypothetical protein
MRTTTYVSRPAFVVDPNSVGSTSGRQIAWEYIPEKYRRGAIQVTAGAAAQGATALPVTALDAPIPAGTVLDFGGDEQAVTTAAAAQGATSLAVRALVNALEGGEVATFVPQQYRSAGKHLPAGKCMAAMTDGRLCTRAERPGAETASELLKTAATEFSESDSLSGYGTYESGRFYENLLPDSTGTPRVLPAQYKTELRAAGGAWRFEQYADSRG